MWLKNTSKFIATLCIKMLHHKSQQNWMIMYEIHYYQNFQSSFLLIKISSSALATPSVTTNSLPYNGSCVSYTESSTGIQTRRFIAENTVYGVGWCARRSDDRGLWFHIKYRAEKISWRATCLKQSHFQRRSSGRWNCLRLTLCCTTKKNSWTFQPEVPRYAITEHAVAHITIITATLSLSVYVPLRAQKIIHHMVMPDA